MVILRWHNYWYESLIRDQLLDLTEFSWGRTPWHTTKTIVIKNKKETVCVDVLILKILFVMEALITHPVIVLNVLVAAQLLCCFVIISTFRFRYVAIADVNVVHILNTEYVNKMEFCLLSKKNLE